MQVDLKQFNLKNKTVAVALSGGSDSMALIYYMQSVIEKFSFKLIALNVEHGIRGADSVADTDFVINYCKENSIPLLTYTINCLEKAEKEKLSVEQAARALRYECFYDALTNNKCDLIATAHHSKDNMESVLFNLFRGTGLSGASGINANFQDKIIRPFITVSKEEIDAFVKENSIPFVTDKTNFDVSYTRNRIRLNLLPKINEIFPEAEKSVLRFSEILSTDNDYLNKVAVDSVKIYKNRAEIALPLHKAIFGRAVIIALKSLGVKRDWEKTHIDSVFSLCAQENGNEISLPKNVIAVREYDKITIFTAQEKFNGEIPFNLGETKINGITVSIKTSPFPDNLKDGFYGDKDKIPLNSVIRTRRDGDKFKKFGGGTKNLNDYFTDKKIPKRLRDDLILLADGNEILAIFGLAVSDKIRVDENTKNILTFNII